MSEPPVTVVAPEYVLTAVKVTVPDVVFDMEPVPARTADTEPDSTLYALAVRVPFPIESAIRPLFRAREPLVFCIVPAISIVPALTVISPVPKALVPKEAIKDPPFSTVPPL